MKTNDTNKKSNKRGKFIVIDGGEGSGKTTILKWFAETPFGKKFLITHEPGGTEFADKIRALVLSKEAKEAGAETQFCLMWAARAEHLKKKIIPALAKGVSVISDRFDSSTYAYQIYPVREYSTVLPQGALREFSNGVYGQKAKHLEKLFWQTREVFLRERKPDFYIFLDVEPKVGLQRVAGRKETKTHFDERKLDFHKRVRAGFLEFLKYVPRKIIDANQPIESVKTDFLKCVKMVL